MVYYREAADPEPPEVTDLTEQNYGPGELLFAVSEHEMALPGRELISRKRLLER